MKKTRTNRGFPDELEKLTNSGDELSAMPNLYANPEGFHFDHPKLAVLVGTESMVCRGA